MRPISTTLIGLGLIAILINCSGRSRTKPGACTPEKALPAKLSDFARKSDIRVFDKENLWRFIDGAAETYLQYGFDKVATADYAGSGRQFSVEIYCFADPLGAFGIYAENRTSDEYYVSAGTEGFVAAGLLMFFRGRYFVHVNLYDQDLPRDTVVKIGTAIDSFLPDDNFPMQELARFPSHGRIQHSERYIPRGFLDSDSIASVLTAVFDADSGKVTLFFFRDPSGLGKVKSCLSKRKNIEVVSEHPYGAISQKGDVREIIYADQTDGFCIGAMAGKDSPDLARVLSEFRSRVRLSP